MTIARERSKRRTQKWGWGILLVVSTLVALNGVIWYFMGGSLSTFEQDTGVPLNEFRQAYPTVADQMAQQARQVAIWFGAFGLLALAVALEGFRHRSRWAWKATWVLVATPAASGVLMLVKGDPIGLFYLVFAAVALVGQLLAGRGLAR